MPKISKILRFHFPLFLALLVLLLPVNSYSVPFIDHEAELAMGKGADKQISQQYGIYQDKELQIYVNKIGQKLVSQLSDKIFTNYYFRIVDSSEINAFALPGGYVYVTLGLLAMVNSEAELAGVLGHEIGHKSGTKLAESERGVWFWLKRHSICTPHFNRKNELILFRGRKTDSAPKFWSPALRWSGSQTHRSPSSQRCSRGRRYRRSASSRRGRTQRCRPRA